MGATVAIAAPNSMLHWTPSLNVAGAHCSTFGKRGEALVCMQKFRPITFRTVGLTPWMPI